jgi:hypothetical protein
MKSFKDFLTEKKLKITTSTDAGHSHEGIVDDEGDGKTTKTLPKGHPDHVHDIEKETYTHHKDRKIKALQWVHSANLWHSHLPLYLPNRFRSGKHLNMG